VNHKQHSKHSRLMPNRADCVPALFSRYGIDTIRNDEAKLVLEGESSQLERDSAMIPLVSKILCFVPFILQVYIQSVSQRLRVMSGSDNAP